MKKIRKIELKGIPGDAALQFLRVEMPLGYDPPFALVRYSLNGRMQEHGLRLDLDKRVFLDHFPEQREREAVIEKAAPLIVSYLHSELYEKGDAIHIGLPDPDQGTPPLQAGVQK